MSVKDPFMAPRVTMLIRPSASHINNQIASSLFDALYEVARAITGEPDDAETDKADSWLLSSCSDSCGDCPASYRKT